MRRAVIPAAGRGTRMRPLSQVVPKEMFPVGGRPMLERTVEEALSAGIEAICIVVAPDKREIVERYFDAQPPPRGTLHFAVQPRPLGLMEAVGRAASFTEHQPFAVLLPDNLFLGTPAIAQLLEVEAGPDQHVIGLARLAAEEAPGLGHRGRLRVGWIAEDLRIHRVDAIGPEKRPLEPAPEDEILVNVGRYLFRPDILKEIKRESVDRHTGEIDDLPILDRLARMGRVIGREIEGEYFDVGNPVGYWKANVRLPPSGEAGAAVHRS